MEPNINKASNIYETAGADAAISNAKTVAAGINNSKGSWVELIASTTRDSHGLFVVLPSNENSNDYLFDIGIGAAASEQVILENLLKSQRYSSYFYQFGLWIPAGTRLSTRAQYNAAVASNAYALVLLSHGAYTAPGSMGRVTTYGAATADSGGVSVDPGGTAHTKGAYSEIVASTTNPIKRIYIAFGTASNATMTAATALIDFAVGAAASEQVILSNLPLYFSAQEVIQPCTMGPFEVDIPAGTRLSARAQSSIIDATDRLIDVIIYGED